MFLFAKRLLIIETLLLTLFYLVNHIVSDYMLDMAIIVVIGAAITTMIYIRSDHVVSEEYIKLLQIKYEISNLKNKINEERRKLKIEQNEIRKLIMNEIDKYK